MLLRAGFSAAALFALALPARGADPPAAIWKHQNPFCGVLAQVAPTTDGSGYGVALFAADDFNNAIDMFPANGNGTVKPLMTISGSATGLNAPIGLVITSQNSGQAKARPGFPGQPR